MAVPAVARSRSTEEAQRALGLRELEVASGSVIFYGAQLLLLPARSQMHAFMAAFVAR